MGNKTKMERWKDIDFNQEEEALTVVEEPTATEEEALNIRNEAWPVGKYFTQNSFKMKAFKNTIRIIWKVRKGVEICDIEKNLFTFIFFDPADKDKVLKASPWNFDKHLVILKDMDVEANPREINMNATSFWVRAYEVPVGSRTAQVAKSLGDLIGNFIEWDEAEERKLGVLSGLELR